MTHHFTTRFLILIAFVLLAPARLWSQPARELVISEGVDPRGFLLPIPIHISGFSAAATAVLRQDLFFMGFEVVAPDQAKYSIDGRNGGGRVDGRVIERGNNFVRLTKAYSGANERALIHTLADEIAQTLTKLPGIARTKIVFRADVKSRVSEIYMSDYDGHNGVAVTRDENWTVSPSWAGPGGVFYVSYKPGNPRVYSHELNTGARKSITPYAGSNISPCVSPDGTKVAMVLSKDGNPELFVANANGTGLTRLTRTRDDESSPCWSPDSGTLLFVSRTSGKAALYKVPVTGGTMTRVRTFGVPNATEPDWSPDGKWILFTTLMGSFQICLVKAEGGNVETLTEGEDPSWAANSRAAIFCKGPDRNKRLFLLDVPSKQVKDVPRILVSNSQPSWDR